MPTCKIGVRQCLCISVRESVCVCLANRLPASYLQSQQSGFYVFLVEELKALRAVEVEIAGLRVAAEFTRRQLMEERAESAELRSALLATDARANAAEKDAIDARKEADRLMVSIVRLWVSLAL